MPRATVRRPLVRGRLQMRRRATRRYCCRSFSARSRNRHHRRCRRHLRPHRRESHQMPSQSRSATLEDHRRRRCHSQVAYLISVARVVLTTGKHAPGHVLGKPLTRSRNTKSARVDRARRAAASPQSPRHPWIRDSELTWKVTLSRQQERVAVKRPGEGKVFRLRIQLPKSKPALPVPAGLRMGRTATQPATGPGPFTPLLLLPQGNPPV